MTDRTRPRTVLVLGATGMLGHRLCLAASEAADIDEWATVRTIDPADAGLPSGIIDPDRVLGGLDAEVDEATVVHRLDEIMATVQPDVVVNAVGLVRQRPGGDDERRNHAVNVRFPHVVADRTIADGVHLIHVSTDCVFDGRTGGYDESHPVNATDVYGRAKADGEPQGPGVCVIRTSMIGRQLLGAHGLLEWFLAAEAPVAGYSRARFSGLTTPVLADVLLELARRSTPLTGTFHVAGDPIDKASLLSLLVPHYRPGTEVVPVDHPVIDRTLDGRRFAATTGFVAPSWPTMIERLAADASPYDRWRSA